MNMYKKTPHRKNINHGGVFFENYSHSKGIRGDKNAVRRHWI